jgi:hypothetical protein
MDEAALWGFIGTAVGAAASIGTSWIAGKTASNVEAEKVRQERLEAARGFQRATVLELQEVIHDCARHLSHAHHQDRLAKSKGAEWGTNRLTPEVDEGVRLSLRRISISLERLANAQLREEIRAFTKRAAPMVLAKSEAEATAGMTQAMNDTARLLEDLGTELRRQYPELAGLTHA